MRETMTAVLAIAQKDWLRFRRQPFLLFVSIVMPLVFIFFYAIIVPASATNPVVVALEGDGAAARRFLQTLADIHSQEAAYFEIVTSDPETARRQFENGRAFGLIVIPTDFDQRVAAGTAVVELHINNINSDYSKNLRLRLDKAVYQFNQAEKGPLIAVNETAWLPRDPWMRDYISTSLLLFACLYSGMVNTGLQVAGEWNDRTVKMLLLAPVSRGSLVAGKVLAGLGQSVMSLTLVLLVLTLIFDFSPTGTWWAMGGLILVVLLLGAGLGAIFGVASKQTLATTSILIALSVALFLISGNEDSMRGLAWDGPIVVLWRLARLFPTTYAFLAARSLWLTGETAALGRDLGIVLATTFVVMSGAGWLLRRAYSQLPGGQ